VGLPRAGPRPPERSRAGRGLPAGARGRLVRARPRPYCRAPPVPLGTAPAPSSPPRHAAAVEPRSIAARHPGRPPRAGARNPPDPGPARLRDHRGARHARDRGASGRGGRPAGSDAAHPRAVVGRAGLRSARVPGRRDARAGARALGGERRRRTIPARVPRGARGRPHDPRRRGGGRARDAGRAVGPTGRGDQSAIPGPRPGAPDAGAPGARVAGERGPAVRRPARRRRGAVPAVQPRPAGRRRPHAGHPAGAHGGADVELAGQRRGRGSRSTARRSAWPAGTRRGCARARGSRP
jgi:hypothetical protein